MRPSPQSGTGFAAGFLSALLLLVFWAVLSRTVAWAAATDIIASAHAWWTTPVAVAPSDVFGTLLSIALLAMITYMIFVLPRYIGTGRWSS